MKIAALWNKLLLFLGLGAISLPFLVWILNSKARFLGAWSLPLGIIYFWLCFLAVFVSAMWWLKTSKKIIFAVFMVNVVLFFGDFRIRVPQKQGHPILTWNTAGLSNNKVNPRQRCVREYLEQWAQKNPEGLVFLQESRKFQRKDFEKALGMSCK